MELYGSHFEYADVQSGKYDLILAAVDTSRLASVNGESETVTLYNKRNTRRYYIADSYADSPITFEADIVEADGHTLDKATQREVEKWLFYQKDYMPLYFDVEDDEDGSTWEIVEGQMYRYALHCRFVNGTKLEYNGGVVGYHVFIECDSPLGWEEPMTKAFATGEFTLEIDTDLPEFLYPKVTIQLGTTGGTITIINESDDAERKTTFIDIVQQAIIKMDGATNYINGVPYTKFQDKNFIRLVDGENKFKLTGDIANITFEWQNRRYL